MGQIINSQPKKIFSKSKRLVFFCGSKKWLNTTHRQCPAGRVFQYQVGSGIGENTGQRVGFGSGRSVKTYDRVFPGIFFTHGYFRVFRVFPGMSGIFGYFWVYPRIY